MIVGLGLLAILAGGVFLIVRAISGHQQHSASTGHSVRRFFQYSLLFALVVVVGIGLAGLLDRVISPASLVAADQVSLARNTSFALVGIPVLLGVANWTKRTVKSDKTETSSFGWAAYFLFMTVTALASLMIGVATLLAWIFGLEDFSSYAISQSLIWSVIWYLHFQLNLKLTPNNRSKFLFLFNSLIGLITSVVALGMVIAGIARNMIGISGKDALIQSPDLIKSGAIMLLIGAPVWLLYWVKLSMNSTKDVLWLGYVLIPGVAGGLITAIVSASTLFYRVLVWFLGDPVAETAALHFRSAPTAIGAVFAGLILLWYHNHFAATTRTAIRNDVQRIYEYLISGISLVASTVGLVLIIVTIFDAIASNVIVGRTSAVNTLLAALTLLLVGAPIWYLYWHRIQINMRRQPELEAGSGVRKIYLFLLFGAGGVLAVGTMLTATFILFESVFASNPVSDLVREIRYPVSILLGTILITAYHWNIYSSDREITLAEKVGPKLITLIGPKDETLRRDLQQLTGGRVQVWENLDATDSSWNAEQIFELVRNSTAEHLVITMDKGNPSGFSVKS